MKKSLVFIYCTLILSIFSSENGFSQDLSNDVNENIALEKAKNVFTTSIKLQSRLFNGPTYYTYAKNVGGSAIFLDTNFINGPIIYEGLKYNNVPLMYDLYIDKLVSIVNGEAYSFLTENVDEFEISNHHFKYFDFANTTTKVAFEPGFFEVLYDGKIKVIAKHVEKLGFSTNLDMPYYFKPSISYLLIKDNQCVKFSDDGSLINALNKNKKEMKKQLQDANIKFSTNPTETIVLIAKYYDSLAN